MKIGVVSDTHRNKEYLSEVVTWLVSRHHITTLYHLGDDYEDVIDLGDMGIEVVQVPGIYHARYRKGSLPVKQRETVLGLQILLVHALEKDVTDEDRRVSDIILFGHTHRAQIILDDGLLLMNPGHLKSAMDKNAKPSFGLLDIQDRTVAAKIFGLDHKEIESMVLVRSESGLFRS